MVTLSPQLRTGCPQPFDRCAWIRRRSSRPFSRDLRSPARTGRRGRGARLTGVGIFAAPRGLRAPPSPATQPDEESVDDPCAASARAHLVPDPSRAAARGHRLHLPPVARAAARAGDRRRHAAGRRPGGDPHMGRRPLRAGPPDLRGERARRSHHRDGRAAGGAVGRPAGRAGARAVEHPQPSRAGAGRPAERRLQPEVHVRPVRDRRRQPPRARRLARGRGAAGPGLQPAVPLRPARPRQDAPAARDRQLRPRVRRRDGRPLHDARGVHRRVRRRAASRARSRPSSAAIATPTSC